MAGSKCGGGALWRRGAINLGMGAFFLLALMAVQGRMAPAFSKGGSYVKTEHGGVDANGNSNTGVSRAINTPAGGYTIDTSEYPAGQCIHCHDEHSSYEANGAGASHTPQNHLAYASNAANAFCYECHQNAITASGSYTTQMQSWQGQTIFNASSHGINGNMLWPGTNPASRASGEQNGCINCHNPHGRTFSNASESSSGQTGASYIGTDAMPNMTFRLEENLCLTCHDASGPAVTDIATSLTYGTNSGSAGQFYSHPISRHTSAGDRSPSVHTNLESKSLGGAGNKAMHSECADCHNPHYAQSGTHAIPTNLMGNVLKGAWGVQLSGGWPAAGGTPAWSATPVLLTNTATQYEHQLCFRCHSSFSTQSVYSNPFTFTDVSAEFNPNNLAHHAVISAGKNTSSNANFRNSFRSPVQYNSVITCSDCHTGDTSDPSGPHGSSNIGITGTFCDSAAGATCGTQEHEVICFKCHRYDVYFDAGVSLSRFDHPAGKSAHQYAYNRFGIWCLNCHGGGQAGGIHGTNKGVGSAGASSMGVHFFTGSTVQGLDESGTCYSKSSYDAFNDDGTGSGSECTQHPGGKAWTPIYAY